MWLLALINLEAERPLPTYSWIFEKILLESIWKLMHSGRILNYRVYSNPGRHLISGFLLSSSWKCNLFLIIFLVYKIFSYWDAKPVLTNFAYWLDEKTEISFIEAAFYEIIYLSLCNNNYQEYFVNWRKQDTKLCLSYTTTCVNVYECVYAYDYYFCKDIEKHWC